MDIHQIEYFLQLKEYEHVAIAADFLNISQPALSKSIASLEKELGVKLFDRVGRRIKLNRNGEVFAEYAEQAIRLLEQGRLSARNMCYETNGYISILCYTYAPIIMPCVNAYLELNPRVNFSVNQLKFYTDDAHMNTPDFILCSSSDTIPIPQQKDAFWNRLPLFQEGIVLIASPEYQGVDWNKYEGEIDVTDLKDANFITMSQSDLFFQDFTYAICQRAGFFPKTYGRTDDFLVKMKMVDQARGVSLLPESCLEDAARIVPGLLHFRLKDQTETRTVQLLHPKSSQMTESARDFLGFVLDYYNLQKHCLDKTCGKITQKKEEIL